MTAKIPDDLEQWFDDIQIRYASDDISNLKNNIELLKSRGLSSLNDRLFEQTKRIQFLSTLTEHNFAANLLKLKTDINEKNVSYEPSDIGNGRPDLHITYNGVNFIVQIKRFSQLKFRNIQNKIYNDIERELEKIEIGKFVDLRLPNNFTKNDIRSLVNRIQEIALKENNEANVSINGAVFSLRKPNKLQLNHITFGKLGDLEAVEITGLAREQIKSSLLKAAKAFERDSDRCNINLIVAETNGSSHDVIDLCEALYGSEYSTFDEKTGKALLHRYDDGLYMQDDFSKKVAGVIALRRKNYLLIDEYWQVLCSKPDSDEVIGAIRCVFQIDKTTSRFSELGNGFFGFK